MRPMSRRPAAALLLAALAACGRGACSKKEVVPSPAGASLRRISQGTLVGFEDQQGTHAWLGIPYAAPPVGARRWRAPLPPAGWEGTREALRFGSPCVQFGGPISGTDTPVGEVAGSEDCLTLNVWAPRFSPGEVPQGAAALPVMVWIHGGGNSIGTAVTYPFARNLAGREGVVVVTMNYRLGVLGWLHHPALAGEGSSPEDRSGNFGTLDLIRALEWVREEIPAFGGNPGNVTIFGESAGGIDVYSLLSSPRAKGLFHKAIAQSGFPATYSAAQAENFEDDPEPGDPRSSRELLATYLVADQRAQDRAGAKAKLSQMSPEEIARYLRSKPPRELLAPFKKAAFGMYFAPFLMRDGAVLPQQPLPELLSDPSRYNAVPFIAGTNRDELKLFLMANDELVSRFLGVFPKVRDADRYNRVARYFSDAWKAMGVDGPVSRMRNSQGPTVFAYRFDWDNEGSPYFLDLHTLLGASHAMEIPFVFMALDEFGKFAPLYRDDDKAARQALAEAMASYWAQFARTGSPGRGSGELPEWTPWDDSAPAAPRFIVFDRPEGGGIRMSSEALSAAALKQRLLEDPALANRPKDRCRLYAGMFRRFGESAGEWDLAEYRSFGPEGCRDVPPEVRW